MPFLPVVRRTLGLGTLAGVGLATYAAWEARQYTLRRVTVPLLSSTLAALVAVLLTAWFSPAIGVVLAGLMVAVAATCWLAWVLESHSRDELLESRAEVLRISDLVARQAAELQAIGATATASGWLDAAHDTLRRAVRRQSRGRALMAAALLVATAVATNPPRPNRCSR